MTWAAIWELVQVTVDSMVWCAFVDQCLNQSTMIHQISPTAFMSNSHVFVFFAWSWRERERDRVGRVVQIWIFNKTASCPAVYN